MRQAGILAAAGLYALEHNVDRLAEDHANAKRLGALLTGLGAELLHPAETNLLFVIFPDRAASELVARFRSEGVLCNAEGSRPDMVSMLTHLDVTAADIEEAARRVARVLG
jgi:threonine aldolase